MFGNTLLFLVLAVGSIRTSLGAFGLGQAGNDQLRCSTNQTCAPKRSCSLRSYINISLPILSLPLSTYSVCSIDSKIRKTERRERVYHIQPTSIFLRSPLRNSSPRIQPTATYPRPSITRNRTPPPFPPMGQHKNRPTKQNFPTDASVFRCFTRVSKLLPPPFLRKRVLSATDCYFRASQIRFGRRKPEITDN